MLVLNSVGVYKDFLVLSDHDLKPMPVFLANLHEQICLHFYYVELTIWSHPFTGH
jgi:hypothetical protein